MIQDILYQEKGLVHKDLDLQRLFDSHVAESFFKFVRLGNTSSPVSHEDVSRMRVPSGFSNFITVNSKNLEYAETISLRDIAKDIERLLNQEDLVMPMGLYLNWGVDKETLSLFKNGFNRTCDLCEFLIHLRVYRIGDKSYYFITRESVINPDPKLGQVA